MSEEQASAEEMFEQWDGDGDGFLNRDELALKLSDEAAEECIAAFGSGGKVSAKQFPLLWRYIQGDAGAKVEAEALKKFEEMDTNGDGQLSVGELSAWLGDAAKRIIAMADADNNGLVDAAEFLEVYRVVVTGDEVLERDLQQRYYTRVFGAADADGDGLLTATELVTASAAVLGTAMELEEVEDMIAAADGDGDGKITLQEFLRALGSA